MPQREGVEIVTIEIRIVENKKYIAIIRIMELLPKHIVERRVKFVRVLWYNIEPSEIYEST